MTKFNAQLKPPMATVATQPVAFQQNPKASWTATAAISTDTKKRPDGLSAEAFDLCRSILCYRRGSGDAAREWVTKILTPAIDRIATDFEVDAHHNVTVTVPSKDGTHLHTLFTSHTDTVHNDKTMTKQTVHFDKHKQALFKQDGTPLGADDGTGIAIMLHMIANKVPGIYAFFMDEEIGRVGSKRWADDNADVINNLERVISFDRKDGHSIISKQSGQVCCSQAFVKGLSIRFAALDYKMDDDPTGSFTDSYTFIDDVAECTNLSVGYMWQHGPREYQKTDTFDAMLRMLPQIDWSKLPTERDPSAKPQYDAFDDDYFALRQSTNGTRPAKSLREQLEHYMDNSIEREDLVAMMQEFPYMVAETLIQMEIYAEDIERAMEVIEADVAWGVYQ